MAEPFIGEIRLFPMTWAPQGWAQCKGQLLQIAQNQALFTLLSTIYGGDGKTTFGLPNLCGRVPLHPDQMTYKLGASQGEEAHALTIAEMPQHTHTVSASNQPANSTKAATNVWPNTGTNNFYSANANNQLSVQAFASSGGGQGHPNLQPYLVLNFCIALVGYYPPRN